MKTSYRASLLLIVATLIAVVSSAQGVVGNEVGNEAPDFTLPDIDNELVTLSNHRGADNVVLIFYRGKF